MKNSFAKTAITLSLAYLLVATAIGLFLRLALLDVIELPYSNLLHTHSHVAFMGWVFNIIFVLIVKKYRLEGDWVKRQFIGFQVATIGMMLSFPVQGYGAVSIAFSTLHIVVSLMFLRRVFPRLINTLGGSWVRAGMIFMAVSALGPFTLGPLAAMGFKGSLWYNLSIQYYLHFYYNGWFFLTLIGLLITKNSSLSPQAYKWLIAAMIPLFFTAAMVYDQDWWIRSLSIAGSLMFAGVVVLIYRSNLLHLSQASHRWLPPLILISLVLKALMQLMVNIPTFDLLIGGQRHLIVGFMHLTFLGILTPIIFILLSQYYKLNHFGIYVYAIGYLITELVLLGSLFIYPTLIPLGLVMGAATLFLGIAILFSGLVLSSQLEKIK